jgi:hypothetical protein
MDDDLVFVALDICCPGSDRCNQLDRCAAHAGNNEDTFGRRCIGCGHYCYYGYALPQAETDWRREILFHEDIAGRLEKALAAIPPEANTKTTEARISALQNLRAAGIRTTALRCPGRPGKHISASLPSGAE